MATGMNLIKALDKVVEARRGLGTTLPRHSGSRCLAEVGLTDFECAGLAGAALVTSAASTLELRDG